MPDVTVTMITTAAKIEVPYIQPFSRPYVAIPNTKDTTAATQSTRSI